MKRNTPVILKTFLGKTSSKEDENMQNNFWKLIGLKGIIIDENGSKVLVKFEKNLDDYNIANHNPIKNTLWINKYDLEINEVEIYYGKINAEISKRVSLMNNTKWYKLFDTLSKNQIYSVQIKFLLSDYISEIDVFKGFNETGFEDVTPTGPFLYKEIEWIRIYEKTIMEKNGIKKIEKTITEMGKILNDAGKFEYQKDKSGIKIYGYK